VKNISTERSRTIHKANRRTDDGLFACTARLSIHGSTKPTATVPAVSVTSPVKLLAIKLEPFVGNVETWFRFWEQFRSSIDDDPSLSTIKSTSFSGGYLEGEPKVFVDGIAVTANTYEETMGTLTASFEPTWISRGPIPGQICHTN